MTRTKTIKFMKIELVLFPKSANYTRMLSFLTSYVSLKNRTNWGGGGGSYHGTKHQLFCSFSTKYQQSWRMVSNNLDRTARFQLVQKRKHITLNSYHEAGCEWWMWNLRACVCKKEGPQALDLPGWRDHIPIVWCHETCQNLTLI